jgi:hypothetical protein
MWRLTCSGTRSSRICCFDDVQALPGPDDGTEGAHLPQEEKVEVSAVRAREDAGAEKANLADGEIHFDFSQDFDGPVIRILVFSFGRKRRPTSSLWIHHVPENIVVAFADPLEELGFRLQLLRHNQTPRFREHLRIVEGDLDAQVTEVDSLEALNYASSLGDRESALRAWEYASVVEADGFDD